MEDILGTVHLEMPLRSSAIGKMISLEGATEMLPNLRGEQTRRIWGASLAWIDQDQILQLHACVLTSQLGESLVIKWIEEVIADVDQPIVSRDSTAVREMLSPERVNRPRLSLDRYMFDWSRWAVLPDWEPEVPRPTTLFKLRKQPEQAVRTLLQIQLAYVYSLRRHQRIAAADLLEIYNKYVNIFYVPVHVGSVTWGTARD